MTTGVNLKKWDAWLDASRERTLKTVAGGDVIITHATGARMVAAWTLVPAPRDPVVHLGIRTREGSATPGSAHSTRSRPRSGLRHDRRAVRLGLPTRGPRRSRLPAGAGRYTYTPRKVLRRVLDHSLDHLNQIDQWLGWRRDGLVPTPTDGWVPVDATSPPLHDQPPPPTR